MLAWIKSFFKKEDQNTYDISISDLIEERVDIPIFIPEDRIINNFYKNKPSILIIDDSKGMISIAEDYLLELHLDLNDYNVLTFYGINAGFVMIETLNVLKNKGLEKIEFAIIDIVLPGKIHVDDSYRKMDGIDVAEHISSKYSCKNFLFYSGNTLNYYVDYIEEKIGKFDKIFNKNMRNFLVFKNETDEFILSKFDKLIHGEIHV
jgi:CheY-like chemotaxis protein